MTEFLNTDGGQIAYEVTGGGPLVVLSPGIGDRRQAYRFLAPKLTQAGYRVASADLRTQRLDLAGLLRIRRYRRGMTRLLGAQLLRSLGLWVRYLDVAYPTKPADYEVYMAGLRAKLSEPGRMAEFIKTGKSTPADAQAQLSSIRCPALVIMGSLDPDFADPRAEGEAIAAAMPAGLGEAAMVDGAGHYPHAQSPDEVAALVTGFLKQHARA
jgi:pimeloyl-ACP methyl ester carboxylesterase